MFNDPKRDLYMKEEGERIEKEKEKKRLQDNKKLQEKIEVLKKTLSDAEAKAKVIEIHLRGKIQIIETIKKKIEYIQEHEINQVKKLIENRQLEIERLQKKIEISEKSIAHEQSEIEYKQHEVEMAKKELEEKNAEKKGNTEELKKLEEELRRQS